MTAPARLLALRLQGFKSFPERTVVEFGPGISAVVGPNGSGKSNLADALRWALGEQGRALRSRKSEDVIWAGSERRSALGMADVTLVLDNADGLLPVEYAVLELGRRLYRSGENDYLLNRQRVRLRDLVDLLDGANLADNAFLFIGQGMVDQALALRPEERRPLFEEVAGVRRHERRRRRAEEQLAESETNLARVEDILAELRPQARRLAVQAEQQATRATAGSELADTLILAAHARWHEAATRLATASGRRAQAAAETDRALAQLQVADEAASAIAAELGTRAVVELERREAHEAARSWLTELQLREARLAGDQAATERDRKRVVEERAAAEADLAVQRRALALPAPEPDREADARLADAERSLAEALAELGALRAADRAHGEDAAAVRRAEGARQAELEASRRRAVDADRRATEERQRLAEISGRRADAEARLAAAQRVLAQAQEAEVAAVAAREDGRIAAETAAAEHQAALERAAAAGTTLASLEGRLDAVESAMQEDEARGIARAARRRGGRRLDEDLSVVLDLRPAVEAALAEAIRGYVVARDAIAELAAERGTLVVDAAGRTGGAAAPGVRERSIIGRATELGGGPLGDAIRRDPTGAAAALLVRAVWLPDLAACLEIQPDLPAGWMAVPRDGSAVVAGLTVALGRPDSALERRAEATRLAADVERQRASSAELTDAADAAGAAAARARVALEARRGNELAAANERRRAEDAERVAARNVETIAREAGWHDAQATRLASEADRARAALPPDVPAPAASSPAANGGKAGALDTWETRVAELRAGRDRLAADHANRDAARRDTEARRARAEASIAIDEDRIRRADAEAAAFGDRAAALETERATLRADLAAALARETSTRAVLDELRAADSADRERLSAAERESAATRDMLRAAEDGLRLADHADLEARLGLDGLREQVLVELAGLGELGRRHLLAAAGGRPDLVDDRPGPSTAREVASPDVDLDEAAALEAALDAIAPTWAASAPQAEPPSPGRLTTLRRRYHELGAANPFAVEEYAELRARLEGLETQQSDLRTAISRTRVLIDELNAMIATQFSTTFRALEAAFDRQFNGLFGGGYAKLSLTDPDDLAGTGIEIVARPPGKKAQALAMLSGGERALTAVALLFAMLEVRPVPFCVLDEVDAALDEANVGRFSDALRKLADRTQFIVITHNRGTIEAADALYGVTVGDDSASRVVSLRLDEARTIAERRRPSEPAGATVR
jgi:chromosome segregation protein